MAKLVFGLNLSLDGFVNHMAFGQQSPALFRHFIEHVRGVAGFVHGRGMYEVMRYWDDNLPDWDAEERDFAAAWRAQPKWVVSRTLSVGPDVEGDLDAAIPGAEGSARRRDCSWRTRPGTKPDRPWSY